MVMETFCLKMPTLSIKLTLILDGFMENEKKYIKELDVNNNKQK